MSTSHVMHASDALYLFMSGDSPIPSSLYIH
jgi:hypothetical protein